MVLTKVGKIQGEDCFELNLLVLGRKKSLVSEGVKTVVNLLSDILFGKDEVEGIRFLEGIKNGETVRLERNEGKTTISFNGKRVYDGEKAQDFIKQEFPFDVNEFKNYFLTFDNHLSFSWLKDKKELGGSFLDYLRKQKDIFLGLGKLTGLLGKNKDINQLDKLFKKNKKVEFAKCLSSIFLKNTQNIDELVKDIEKTNEQIFLSEEKKKLEGQIKKIDVGISSLEEQIRQEEKRYKVSFSSLKSFGDPIIEKKEEKEIQNLKSQIPLYEKLEEKEEELSKIISSIDEVRNRIALIKREKKSLENVVSPNKKILDSYDQNNDQEILELEEELGSLKRLRQDITLVQSLLVMVDNLAEACEEEEGLYWQAKDDKDWERAEEARLIWKNDEKERKDTEKMILNLLSPFEVKEFNAVRSILPKKIAELTKDYNSLNENLQKRIEKRNRKEYAEKVLYYQSIKFPNLAKDNEKLSLLLTELLKKEKIIRKEINELSSGAFISRQDIVLSIEAKETKAQERKKNLALIKEEFEAIDKHLSKLKEELKSLQKLKDELLLSSEDKKADKVFDLSEGKKKIQKKEEELKKSQSVKAILDDLVSLCRDKDKFLEDDIKRFDKIIEESKVSLNDEVSWSSSIQNYFLASSLNDLSKHLTHIYKEKRELSIDGRTLIILKKDKKYLFDELGSNERLALFLALKLRFEKCLMKLTGQNRRNYFFAFTSLSHKELNATLKALGLREFPLITIRTVK